jgi:hypothetical protein
MSSRGDKFAVAVQGTVVCGADLLARFLSGRAQSASR